MEKCPIRILVTGAAGQFGYALLPMIAQGMMLGPDQPVILHILGNNADSLKGIQMELDDSIFPLLKDVVATTDIVEACQGINIAILAGGAPMNEGMRRKDFLPMNAPIYKAQASAVDKHAAPNCKVVMVANPANTNALVFKEFAPSIPAKNITCLTRLDHNRATGLIAEKLNVPFSDVKNVIVWGNHSPSQYPDMSFATVTIGNREQPVKDLVDEQWLHTEYITAVQHRGDALIKTRKKNSAFSAAKATCDHIRDWFLGTLEGEWVSMGVCSDGSYGIEPGLIYSFPVTCQRGEWSIVQGLKIDEFSRKMMEVTEKELIEERDWAYSCLEEYDSCEE